MAKLRAIALSYGNQGEARAPSRLAVAALALTLFTALSLALATKALGAQPVQGTKDASAFAAEPKTPEALGTAAGAAGVEKPRPWYRFEASLEMGFLGVPFHRYQQGLDGTWFDFRKEGGQENLFLFLRTSAGIRILDRHVILFLYQPLSLSTRAVLKRDVTQEGVTFPEGTAVNLRYGFDFYRASYLYDIFKDPRFELGVGASMQIRNADISFTSADGSLRALSQNLGPVPALKIRARYTFPSGWWIGMEADGIYANIKGLNGSTREVTGAILDASIRAGIHFRGKLDVFVNLRYLGGGAKGGGPDENSQGDGYTRNWLHFVTLSLGLGLY
ncbi:MAG: hypothetical protein RBU30_12020 [Polyangia bacterium]|nr:hypothetical protein [Polyangia bacterium]